MWAQVPTSLCLRTLYPLIPLSDSEMQCLPFSLDSLLCSPHWETHLRHLAAAAAKSLQSCPTLCDPIDSSSPGSSIPGILQARTLEWVAISFSNAWKWKVKVKSLSCVRLFTTPWTAAYQAPPSMGFSRQEYWSGVPLPSPNNGWQKAKCLWYSCFSIISLQIISLHKIINNTHR